MRLPPLLLLAPLALAGLAMPPTAAHAADPTCQGLVATIVSDEFSITGTEGPDVISAGATTKSVTALGGDDVVCAFSGAQLDTGDGDDRVVTTAPPGGPGGGLTLIKLGAGDDTFTGSEGADSVDGSGGTDSADSAGTDTISTGGGDDMVGTGVPGVPNADVVDLGAGADNLDAVLPAGSSARLSPGPAGEFDILTLLDSGPVGSLDVDLGGSVAADGAPRATIAGFGFVILQDQAAARLTVRGTASDDRIVVAGDTGRIDVTTGAGADVVTLRDPARRTRGRLDLGRGRDLLDVVSPRQVRVDLEDGRLVAGTRRPASVRLAGVDDVLATAADVRVAGDRAANDLRGIGCAVTVAGGRGPDVLSAGHYSEDKRHACLGSPVKSFEKTDVRRVPAVLLGNEGADTLEGGALGDTLIGGPGTDRADGADGRDLCRTERKRSCER